MSTVIYLSNQQVQIVNGTAKGKKILVKSCLAEEAPEGSIINGLVMNIDSFTEFIKNLRVQKKIPAKDVSLVINSTKFVGRTIELPVMNDKKTFRYIAREYNDVGKSDDSIFGYITLLTYKKFKKVYAEAISPDFIKDYIDIFSAAGVKLSGIYSGEGTTIGFTGRNAETHIKNFQLIIAENNSFTTVLWINGVFTYYNSTRCFHEPGSAEYASDIARIVSQTTQFMKANQMEEHLERIYLAGVDSAHHAMCVSAIGETGVGTQVDVYHFKTNGVVNDYHQRFGRAISGLIEYDKNTNYLTRYNKLAKEKNDGKDDANLSTGIIIIGLSLLLMILILVGGLVFKNSKQKELDAMIDYNTSPDMIFQTTYYDIMMRNSMFMSSQYNSIVGLDENLNTYPRGNTAVLDVFEDCARGYAQVTYLSFDAEAGTVVINAKARDVDNINKFIKNLTTEDIFNKVVYTGYQFDDSDEKWNINVTCTLAESAGL